MIVVSRRIVLSAVTVGAAAIAMAGAVPAYAVATVTVKAGSAPSGTTVAIQLALSSGAELTNLATGATGRCSSSSLTGTTKAGANSPSNFMQINGGPGQVIYKSCNALGLPFTITGVGTGKWPIAATGNTASGTTPTNITGINVLVDSASCRFNISGSAPGSYVNGNPSRLTIARTTAATSKLVVSNIVLKGGATKCLGGAVTNTTPGNKISLSATYNVTAATTAYNPVTVTAS